MELKVIEFNSENNGIFSIILIALEALYFKKKKEIIYFKFNNLLYSNNYNLWDKFFIQPFAEFEDLIEKKIRKGNYKKEYFNKNKFPLDYISLGSKVFYDKKLINHFREIFKKRIVFCKRITDKALRYENKYLNNKTLSIHLRGTDRFTKDGHFNGMRKKLKWKDIEDSIQIRISKNKISKLFLATDDQKYKALIKKKFNSKLLKSYSTILSKDKGAHYENIYQNEIFKTKLGDEAIVDSILLSRSKYSLICQSNLSLVSILMRNDFNYKLIDEILKSRGY